MDALDSRFNIDSCVRANDARRSNELPHREHRLAAEQALREQAIAKARVEKEEAEACKDDMIVDDITPKVNEILVTKGDAFVHRGYSVVFRGVAHVLPHSFKFTVRGAKIIQRALALCTSTALQMSDEWAAEAAADLVEIERQEIERNEMRRIEDAEIVSNLRKEIAQIIATRATYTRTDNGEQQLLAKSYFGLFGHLSGMLLDNTRVRGLRMVRLIHDAMISQIQWATHWETQMARATKRAEQREADFLNRRQQEKGTKHKKAGMKRGNRNAEPKDASQIAKASPEEVEDDSMLVDAHGVIELKGRPKTCVMFDEFSFAEEGLDGTDAVPSENNGDVQSDVTEAPVVETTIADNGEAFGVCDGSDVLALDERHLGTDSFVTEAPKAEATESSEQIETFSAEDIFDAWASGSKTE